jgi:hypothetical protein
LLPSLCSTLLKLPLFHTHTYTHTHNSWDYIIENNWHIEKKQDGWKWKPTIHAEFLG